MLPFLRPYRLRVAAALLCLLGAAGATLAIPAALGALVDAATAAPDAASRAAAVRAHLPWLLLASVVLGVLTGLRFWFVTWLGERVTADLRSAVVAALLRQDAAFFETLSPGEVTSRLTADTTLVQALVGSSLSMGLRSALLFAGAMAMLVATSPRVAGSALVALVVVVVPLVLAGRRLRRLSRASHDRIADAGAMASEVLGAVEVVQAFGQEARESRRFAALAELAFAAAMRRTRVRALLTAYAIPAVLGSLLLGLHAGTLAVTRGELTAGALAQSALFIALIASSSAVLAEVWGDVQRAAGAADRLAELLAARPRVASPTGASVEHAAAGVAAGRHGTAEDDAGLHPARRRGVSVSLRGVRFHYPSRPEVAALDGIDLEVRAGETVALVGVSGAGKSTVLQLLQRRYDPQGGRVLLDGVPIDAMPLAALRSRIALVPQSPVVFSADVRENIRYGRPDATEAEVLAASRAAQVDAFVRALPEGYATALGERGMRLSGGQRQRIAIARAILLDAPLLLLDEATSSLDAESERAVQAALEVAMQGRTTIVIAHRLSTVQRADRIVVLDRGRVVEAGTHAELLRAGGRYARLASLQLLA